MKFLLFLLLLPVALMGQADYQTILPNAVALYKAQNSFRVYDYQDVVIRLVYLKVAASTFG